MFMLRLPVRPLFTWAMIGEMFVFAQAPVVVHVPPAVLDRDVEGGRDEGSV